MGGILIIDGISGWKIDLFALCMKNWVADVHSHLASTLSLSSEFHCLLSNKKRDITVALSLIKDLKISRARRDIRLQKSKSHISSFLF